MTLLLLLSLLLLLPNTSLDCDTLTGYDYAQQVFIGEVTQLQDNKNDSYTQITLQVHHVYKSENERVQKNQTTLIYSVSNIYGYIFELGQTYLIFQRMEGQGRLVLDGCTLTAPIRQREGKLAFPSLAVVQAHNWPNSSTSVLSKYWLLED